MKAWLPRQPLEIKLSIWNRLDMDMINIYIYINIMESPCEMKLTFDNHIYIEVNLLSRRFSWIGHGWKIQDF